MGPSGAKSEIDMKLLEDAARVLAPPAIAICAVAVEPYLGSVIRVRESLLPIGVFVLLVGVVHPRVRRMLVRGLCYLVAFLALRDMVRGPARASVALSLTPTLRLLRDIGLAGVATLAVGAATLETLRPGTLAARRFYFAAAGAYILGMAILHWRWSPEKLLLAATGLTGLAAALVAERLLPVSGSQNETAQSSDDDLQRARDMEHRLALKAKEWDDVAQDSADASATISP
jgi:hypothetical protein